MDAMHKSICLDCLTHISIDEELTLPEEQIDLSLDEGGEHLGTIRGTYESEEGNIQVISGEYMDTHIIEDKRNIKEDNIGLADARTDASLICADAHLLEYGCECFPILK